MYNKSVAAHTKIPGYFYPGFDSTARYSIHFFFHPDFTVGTGIRSVLNVTGSATYFSISEMLSRPHGLFL